jgi:shikimate kinase
MNIILMGYRGTGKSVLGKVLSRKLKRSLYRIDDLIVASAGQPISEIVAQEGWPAFRKIESRIVKEISESAENSIIDCGGGVVLDPENVKNLKRHGKIVLLTASFSAILKRLRGDPKRPALKPGLTFEEEQKQILAEREEKYQMASDMVLDTTRKSPSAAADEIIAVCKNNFWIK